MNFSGANPVTMGKIDCRKSVTPKLSRNQSKAKMEGSATMAAKPIPQIRKNRDKMLA